MTFANEREREPYTEHLRCSTPERLQQTQFLISFAFIIIYLQGDWFT